MYRSLSFQFLLVRLRENVGGRNRGRNCKISIPSGAIKRNFIKIKDGTITVISIPSGAIKSSGEALDEVKAKFSFQFLLVRLRELCRQSQALD